MPEHPFPSTATNLPVPAELIERRIYVICGLKVMLDSDLAELYQVETFNLNKAVKRNGDRADEHSHHPRIRQTPRTAGHSQRTGPPNRPD